MRMSGQKYFGVDRLDEKILKHLRPGNPGYFIEIGANNGVAQSNTKHLELFYGWRGLLVEPWRENFDRLHITRSPTTSKVHAACVSFEYSLPTVSLVYSNLLTSAEGVETDKSDAFTWAKGAEHLLKDGDRVRRFEAPAITLDRALDIVGAPKQIDFFSLDVEGAEIEVLKGVDFGKYQFGLICVETETLSNVRKYLEDKGYELTNQISFHDYVFKPYKSKATK
jgi:FkbM family methyltransferase